MSNWEEWWDARISAMEEVLGKMEDVVGHATIPFDIGPEHGGAADVVYFKKHVPGTVAVTAELIGRDDQVQNALGAYELMICHRDQVDWGAELISRLAHYTLQAALNPGETMDIGTATPHGSTISALLFLEYARFRVNGTPAGLLLCLGITEEELYACRRGHHARVVADLKNAAVYPFTDLFR